MDSPYPDIPCREEKGVALILVLGMFLVGIVFANIALVVVLNQARITRHRTGRIQAYYAAQAGMVYELSRLNTVSACKDETFNLPDDPYIPKTISSIVITTRVPVWVPSLGRFQCNGVSVPDGTQCCVSVKAVYAPPV